MKRKGLAKYIIIFLIFLVFGGLVIQSVIDFRRKSYIEAFENTVDKSISNYESINNRNKRLQYLKKWYYKESDYAYALDSNFDFIYHPNSDLIGTAWTSYGVSKFSRVQEELMAGKNRITFIYTFDNTENISVIYKTTEEKFIVFNGNTDF